MDDDFSLQGAVGGKHLPGCILDAVSELLRVSNVL